MVEEIKVQRLDPNAQQPEERKSLKVNIDELIARNESFIANTEKEVKEGSEKSKGMIEEMDDNIAVSAIQMRQINMMGAAAAQGMPMSTIKQTM